MAHGIEPERMSLTQGYGPMPAFQGRLSAAQMADLANYVRSAFGENVNDLSEITAGDVERILQ
jgi:mono/diheme cytochrome c family protein